MSEILPYVITAISAIAVAMIGQYAIVRRARADTRKANADAQKAEAEAAQMFERVAAAAAERVLNIDQRLAAVEEKYQNMIIWVHALIEQLKNNCIEPITQEEAIENYKKNQKRRSTDEKQLFPGKKAKSL